MVDFHTVDDALVVHEANGVADVRQDRGRFIFPERASFYNISEQFATRQQFRHEVQFVFIHNRVFQTDDVGVSTAFQREHFRRELVGDTWRL